jgi:stage V sporulation protein B
MLKRDITVTLSGNFIGAFLSVGTSVILARKLGPANRGLLGLAMLIPAVAVQFCLLGQEMVNATFAGLYKDKRSSLFLQSLIITLFGSVVSIVVICAFYLWLPIQKGEFNRLPVDLVWLICLAPPIAILSIMLTSLVRGVGRITAVALIHVIQIAVLLILLTIFVVWFDFGFQGALVLMVLQPLVAITLSVWVLRDYVTFRLSMFSGRLFKESCIFGSQISLANFAGFLVYRIDQGMLAYMVSPEQVGLYIVAVGLAERLRLLPSSISGAFLPRLANELFRRQPQVPLVFRCTVIVSIVSMLLVGIFGVPAIFWIYGHRYSGMVPAFLLLLPGIASLGGSSVLASDLAARKKPKYSLWTGYTILVINVILNFALIPLMGIAGAALASSISYMGEGILWLVFYRRESGTALHEMIPWSKDVKYVVTGIILLVRSAIISSKHRLKVIRFSNLDKQRIRISD